SAEAFLFDYAEHKDYDILLLDIEMEQIDGVELAKEIRIKKRFGRQGIIRCFYAEQVLWTCSFA
ncbi:MAG: hypothetical protein RSD19_00810, partial [Oscillospiraceae bacterium]